MGQILPPQVYYCCHMAASRAALKGRGLRADQATSSILNSHIKVLGGFELPQASKTVPAKPKSRLALLPPASASYYTGCKPKDRLT